MKKYPSINQFRHVIEEVRAISDYQGRDENGNAIYLHTSDYPVLKFKGTVKCHGTNSAIVRYSDNRTEFQSRERVLSLESDNAGFMNFMIDKNLDFLFENIKFFDYCAVYGEWCGGNIQKGVALNGLPKMFIIFGIKVDDEWIELPKNLHNNNLGIYNILQFETFEVDIDFNCPENVQNLIIDMTLKVEECCPVGKFFGVEGIGEGIVFKSVDYPDLMFKSKGIKHSSSKVKTLNTVDTESLKDINDFVESVVSENRLNQGLSYFSENNIEQSPKNTGEFLSWIVKDVLKEEQDTLTDSNLDEKKVKAAIVNKARSWYLKQL